MTAPASQFLSKAVYENDQVLSDLIDVFLADSYFRTYFIFLGCIVVKEVAVQRDIAFLGFCDLCQTSVVDYSIPRPNEVIEKP